MHLKDLPLSTQVFEDVITSKSLYIDKTTYIHKLIIRGLDEKTGAVACPKYFLSRPRRFGKSMTISTLKAIFEGKKALFEDLSLSKTSYKFHTYPILHLDFSILGKTPETLRHSLLSKLDDFAKNFRVSFSGKTSISEKTEALLLGIGQKSVVLIDEYDAPILDALKESNEAIRTQKCKDIVDVLRDFYLVLKACDAQLRFVFITGVSKFSQVSVFSGLNNLEDISMSEDFAGLCGYTQEELESYFQGYMAKLATKQELSVSETLQKLKYFYNGYRFSPDNTLKVYNPFSVLHAFHNLRFDTKWFQSGTPSFLIEWVGREENPISSLEGKRVESTSFDAREPHQMELIGMMIQTGYLTLRDYDVKADRYILDYPNYEVKKGFIDGLTKYFNQRPLADLSEQLDNWKEWVVAGDWTLFFKEFNRMLAGIPYHLHMPKEAYYHSIFHCVIALLGLRIQSELATSRGRIDTFIETQEAYWIFEFKYAQSTAHYEEQKIIAFNQALKRGYSDQFDTTKPLKTMAVIFDGESKQVAWWGEKGSSA